MTDATEWQARRESNPQPAVLETAALPIELLACRYCTSPHVLPISHPHLPAAFTVTFAPLLHRFCGAFAGLLLECVVLVVKIAIIKGSLTS